MTSESLPQLWRVEPGGQLKLRLHQGQARAWLSKRRFIFMLAGFQSGKTSFGPHWLRREIADRGPGDYLAVTSTFPLLKLKMLPEFLALFQHMLHLGEWHASDRVFEFSGGKTRIIFGSATHPESLESATAKAAWLDECGQDNFKLESWEAIQRRLAIHRGRALGGTTLYNLGWLKQQVYDRWRSGDQDYDVIQYQSTLNPAFPRGEYDRLLATLPTWKANMMLKGLYDRPAGLIYADYLDTYREEGGHLVHPFDLPPEWPRYGGIDPGGVNLARVLVAEDPVANVYYLYSESLSGGKTTAEHVREAKALTAGVNMRTWHGGAKGEGQVRRDWQQAGITLREPRIVDVEAGIDRVIALFKATRLYVFDSCAGIRDELGSYSRELNQLTQEPTEAIKDKETYHRLDALRYLAQGLDLPGPRIRLI